MTVSGGNAVQNSAYRFGVTCGPRIRKDLGAFNFIHAWQAFAFPITPDVGDSRAALPHTPTRIPKGLYGTIPVHPRLISSDVRARARFARYPTPP